MNSTAQRWWSSDKEFYKVKDMDYAVVGWRREDVRHDINFVESRPHRHFQNYYNFLDDTYDSHYYFARRGALVFSDVDGTDEHRTAMLNRDYSVERPVPSEHQRSLAAGLAQALDHMDSDAHSDNCDCPKDSNIDGLGSNDDGNADIGSAPLGDCEIFPTRRLDYDAVKHIITLSTKDDKSEMMNMVSAEVAQKTPRPTMLLAALFSNHQSVTVGEGSGYVVAYDSLENRIVVKPYKATLDHHPLGEPWFTAQKPDMITYVGSPGALARRIAQREGLGDESSSNYGFALVARIVAGQWILSHQDALKTVPGPGHGDLLDEATVTQLRDTLEEHETELSSMPFPNKIRAENPKSTVNFAHSYYAMTQLLEDIEGNLRRCALDGKEKGQEKAADNLAKFYERVLEAAAALAKDPEADVGL